MALERRQLDRLEADKGALEARKKIFTDLSSKLSALRTLANQLAGGSRTSPIYAFSATATDDERVSVTATSSATTGSYRLSVASVARRHALASAEFELEETTIAEGTYRFGITLDGEETEVAVTVDAGETNETVLGEIASAINGSAAAVSAHVTTTASGQGYLVIRSQETGVDHLISNVRDLDGSLMSDLGLAGASSPTQYSAATTQEASDAEITLDGLTLRSSSNTFKSAIPGVTLVVHAETVVEGTVAVSADKDAIQKAVEEFISTYNSALAEVRTQVTGDLRGQPLVRELSLSLRRATSLRVSSVEPGELSTLAEIGIAIGRDGSLSLANPSKLKEKLSDGAEQVAQLFDVSDGIANRIEELVDDFLAGSGPLSLIRRQNEEKIKRLDVRILREESRLELRESAIRRDLAKIQELISAIGIQQQIVQGFF
jgi:flagellar hook-associated protein 2